MQYKNDDKKAFITLLINTAHDNSSDKNIAKTFLANEGVNVDKVTAEAMKRIRKIQTLANADKTAREMAIAESFRQKATEWADNLINNIDFSFPEIVQKEQLTISFRKIESLSTEDIRNLLIKHFMLKFMTANNKDVNGL